MRNVLAVDDRHGDAFPVARRSPDEFARVSRRIELAEHRVALQQRGSPRRDVLIVGRAGRRERGVDVTQLRRVDLGIRRRIASCRRDRPRRCDTAASPSVSTRILRSPPERSLTARKVSEQFEIDCTNTSLIVRTRHRAMSAIVPAMRDRHASRCGSSSRLPIRAHVEMLVRRCSIWYSCSGSRAANTLKLSVGSAIAAHSATPI